MTRDDTYRTKELGDFLKQHRERVRPDDVGLQQTGHRRTPGLRREEVAHLVGISTAWYTRLEQGYDIRPSIEVLERIGHVLHLDHTQKMHLFTLARGMPRLRSPIPDEQTMQAIQRVLDNQDPHPAYLIGQHWDIVSWNSAACAVFANFPRLSELERNSIYYMFTNPDLRHMTRNWETHARNMLRQFRADYAQDNRNPAFTDLIDLLLETSAEFRAWWQQPEVSASLTTHQELTHPLAGRLSLEQSVYLVANAPGFRLVLHMPLDTETDRKLHQLYTSRVINRHAET